MKKIIVICFVLLVCLMSKNVLATVYQGSLSTSDGGLTGTGVWADGSSLSWEISEETGYWHYQYILVVQEKSISHFIIEASDSFTCDDLFNASGAFASWFVDNFSASNGNPGMPGNVYGIKFDETSGINLTIEFDSYRMPIWGDFYSKDGKTNGIDNVLWNAGFEVADPTVDAHDGSEAYHLLVPDTIPEPATLLILAFGSSSLLIRRRR